MLDSLIADRMATPPREVISRSTIFILSGILIGTGLGKEIWNAAAFMNVLTGMTGLIAFYALDQLATQRSRRAARTRLQRIQRKLAGRIERHVKRYEAPLRTYAPRPNSTAQYLAVVSRKG